MAKVFRALPLHALRLQLVNLHKGAHMKKVLRILLLGSSCFLTAVSAQPAIEKSQDAELQAIVQHEKQVAMVLAQQGFTAYAALFHPDYRNWGFGRPPRDRTTFLADSKRWYDKGNRAIAVQMQPLHNEIIGDMAFSQYRLREDFNDGTSFIGYFVSIAKKGPDGWLFYNTSYHTEFYGATADAMVVEPAQPAKTNE